MKVREFAEKKQIFMKAINKFREECKKNKNVVNAFNLGYKIRTIAIRNGLTEEEVHEILKENKKRHIEDSKVMNEKMIYNYIVRFGYTKEQVEKFAIDNGFVVNKRMVKLISEYKKNIDLEKNELHIRHTLQRIYDKDQKKTKIIIDKPKTRNSVRNIPISNKLHEILKELRKEYKDDDYFLTGDTEKYIEPRSYQYIFKDILRKSKIKKYKFHILRHTFATECIEVGMDVKSLSEILGHASVEITLNKYVHSSYKTKKKYLEKL